MLFGLFNEPHGTSWKVWRDGGQATRTDARTGTATTFPAIGMQRLIDGVRGVGANNVLVVGGLDWAYDLGGLADGYLPSDRAGASGIVYDVHLYPWKTDYQKKFLRFASKHPVFVGECGWGQREQFDFLPADATFPDAYEWSPATIAMLQKYKLNWAAWSFHPSAGPCVIQNWQYEPTPHWGAFVRAALAGGEFGPAAPARR